MLVIFYLCTAAVGGKEWSSKLYCHRSNWSGSKGAFPPVEVSLKQGRGMWLRLQRWVGGGAQETGLQGLDSEGFTICTFRHPCPKTSLRIRKNSQTTLHGEKREETFRRATEEAWLISDATTVADTVIWRWVGGEPGRHIAGMRSWWITDVRVEGGGSSIRTIYWA